MEKGQHAAESSSYALTKTEDAQHTYMPDISCCATAKEKIFVFLEYIQDDQRMERIYRFVKYIYFYNV